MQSFIAKEVPESAVNGEKSFRGNFLAISSLAVLGTLAVLALDFFWLAPALINLLESLTGKFVTIELIVRIHFLIVFSQLLVVYFALLFIFPVRDFRIRVLLYFLTGEALILCSIWLLQRPDRYFWSEESHLTFFSSLVLLLCSLTALLNIFYINLWSRPDRLGKIFWLLLSAAFLFAGIDEYFMIHEDLVEKLQGIEISWAGDATTAAYGIGGLIFVAIFYKFFKNGLFQRNAYFLRLMLAGIFCFMLSSVIDTFDFLVADFVNKYILYYSPLNSIEEMLEFTAATLFLCAFVLNLFEVNDHHLLDLTTSGVKQYQPRASLKFCFYGFVVAIVAISIVIGTVYRIKDEPIIAQKGFRVSVFADISDGLNQPDGLIYSPNPGLLLANGNKASNIMIFDRNGHGRIFADAESGLVSPEGMAIWRKSLFVADDSKHQVFKYDQAGVATAVATENRFKSPDGVAVDSQGNLYIADQKLALIIKLAKSSREILASSLDGLKAPEEMVFDDRGNLYVTDEIARAVFKISPEGKTTILADSSRGLANPEGITFHNGRIYATDSKTGIIYRFNPDGSGGKFLTFAKKYRGLSGIAFDDQDNLYVVSADPNSIRGYIFRIEPGRESPAF